MNTCKSVTLCLQSHLTIFAGLDGKVYIYDVCDLLEDSSTLKPLFTHEGHFACSQNRKSTVTTATIWHPLQPNLVISAANDGSLHAWDYVIKSKTTCQN